MRLINQLKKKLTKKERLPVTSVKPRLSGLAGNTENSPDNEKIYIL